MGKITKFEDLIAWQKARKLSNDIYGLASSSKIKSDWGFRNQIQRASVSVMSNIAEGFERNRPNEFHQFLSIAKGSCGEVRSLIYLAYDINYIGPSGFERFLEQTRELSLIINGLRASIKNW